MPTKGAQSSVSAQQGGNILLDVKYLAIPFSLLLAKNGVEYVMKAKKQKTVVKNKPPSQKASPKPASKAPAKNKTQRGGNSGDFAKAANTLLGQITEALEKFQ